MNTVKPITDLDLIKDIANFLKSKSYRDYLMFMFGIYSGLRISDILKLKVSDVTGKESIHIFEKKTGKPKEFSINPELKKAIKEYIRDKRQSEFLFASRQGDNKPITRTRAYIILQAAAKEFHLDSIGTHSMRKTFGYFMYQQYKSLAILKDIFNHADETTTLRYIGLSQEVKSNAIEKLKIF